jgi:hypothetical protein
LRWGKNFSAHVRGKFEFRPEVLGRAGNFAEGDEKQLPLNFVIGKGF